MCVHCNFTRHSNPLTLQYLRDDKKLRNKYQRTEAGKVCRLNGELTHTKIFFLLLWGCRNEWPILMMISSFVGAPACPCIWSLGLMVATCCAYLGYVLQINYYQMHRIIRPGNCEAAKCKKVKWIEKSVERVKRSLELFKFLLWTEHEQMCHK